MAVKLHRCSLTWIKVGHACWRVQKALDAAGIEYELRAEPWRRSRRDEVKRVSGQELYPVIEFEDGSTYHEHSKAMAEKIESGLLFDGRQSATPPPS